MARRDEGNPLDGTLDRCCQETALRLIHFLSDLTARDREIVFGALAGKPLAQVARERHVSRQAVAAAWRRTVERVPALSGLIPHTGGGG